MKATYVWFYVVLFFSMQTIDAKTYATEQDETDLAQHKTRLIIANSKAFKPYAFLNSQGNPDGILIDFWKAFAEKNQLDIEFMLVDWADSLELVKQGSADIHAGLLRSSEREAFFDFGPEILTIDTQLFISSQHNLDVDLILTGEVPLRIGVVIAGYEEWFAKTNYPQMPLIGFANNQLMLNAAARGQLDGFIADFQVANLFLFTANSRYKFFPVRFLYAEALRPGVLKGNNELLTIIEQGFADFKEADRARIFSRWIYMEKVYPRYLFPLLIGATLISVLIYILMLRRMVNIRTKQLRNANQKLTEQALTDQLTQIGNRRFFNELIQQAQQYPGNVGLAIFDIDNFKRVNDQFGHDVGDKAIVHVVDITLSQLGEDDFIARMGGEEFAILMKHQDLSEVENKVHRICAAIARTPLHVEESTSTLTLTVSMGCVYYHSQSFQTLSLIVPDRLMYQAKHAGKNRVILECMD